MDDFAGTPVEGGTPRTPLTRLDLVTLILVWSAPLPSLALNFEGDSPILLMGLTSLLLDLLVLAGTAAIAQRLLGRRSVIRARRGRVPLRYHGVLLGWVALIVAAPVVVGVEGMALGQGFSAWRSWTVSGGSDGLLDPAFVGTLWSLSNLARVLGPIVLLVMRAVDVRSERRSAPEATHGPSDVGDLAALAAVWAAPVLAVAAKSYMIGFGAFMLLYVSPVLIVAAVHGIWVFHSVLGAGSRVRTRLGKVPRSYRQLAWGWALAVFLPGLVFPEFGWECLDGPCPWGPTSVLEALIRAPVPPVLAFAVVLASPVVALVIQVVAHVLRHRHVRRVPESDQEPEFGYPPPPVPQITYFPEAEES